jgi:hypothetical protein
MTRSLPNAFNSSIASRLKSEPPWPSTSVRRDGSSYPGFRGAVVRKGAELGVPTPANAFVCNALKLDVMGTQG